MALKTFNLDEETYKEFSKHCKENGISMSKKVEGFLKSELAKINLPRKNEKTGVAGEHTFSKYC